MLAKLGRAKDILTYVADLRDAYRSPLRIGVAGGREIARLLALDAKPGAVVETDGAGAIVEDLENGAFDLFIRVVKPGDELDGASLASLATFVHDGRFLIVLDARGALDRTLVERTVDTLPPEILEDFVAVLVEADIENRLVPAVLSRFEGSKVALAASVPIFRKPVAAEIIGKTSVQNGVIATIGFIPGADMPVLTANQLKMLLELMAVYGEEPSLGRLTEVLAVVGGGFAFRMIARELLSLLPGPGWIIKGGVAVGGTVAVGKAAQAFFEKDKDEGFEPLASDRKTAAPRGETRALH